MQQITLERFERLEQVALRLIELNRHFSKRADRIEKKLEQVESQKQVKEVPSDLKEEQLE